MSNWPIYQVGTTVVVPFVIRVVGSYHVTVKPLRVLTTNDPNLMANLQDMFSSENMKVVRSEVFSEERSGKELLSIFGARSWKGLYQKCKNWQVDRREGRFSVQRFKASPFGRGLEPDHEATDQIQKEMSLDQVVAFFVKELRTTQ